jgi:membrane protein YdbS with pleckstrin-like domain
MGASRSALPLRPPAHRVSPSAQWLWAIQGTVLTVLVAAVVITLSLVLPDGGAGGEAPHWFQVVLAVARWLLVPLALVSMLIEPLWRFRVHRWEVTADAVYTLEGWLTRTWRIVPISRIQTVDTTRGPLQQLLGLTSIRVRTASHAGSTSIEQLPAPLAAAVAHDLGLRANQVRDEAT